MLTALVTRLPARRRTAPPWDRCRGSGSPPSAAATGTSSRSELGQRRVMVVDPQVGDAPLDVLDHREAGRADRSGLAARRRARPGARRAAAPRRSRRHSPRTRDHGRRNVAASASRLPAAAHAAPSATLCTPSVAAPSKVATSPSRSTRPAGGRPGKRSAATSSRDHLAGAAAPGRAARAPRRPSAGLVTFCEATAPRRRPGARSGPPRPGTTSRSRCRTRPSRVARDQRECHDRPRGRTAVASISTSHSGRARAETTSPVETG